MKYLVLARNAENRHGIKKSSQKAGPAAAYRTRAGGLGGVLAPARADWVGILLLNLARSEA